MEREENDDLGSPSAIRFLVRIRPQRRRQTPVLYTPKVQIPQIRMRARLPRWESSTRPTLLSFRLTTDGLALLSFLHSLDFARPVRLQLLRLKALGDLFDVLLVVGVFVGVRI